jgi:hypothetical protein
MMMTLAISHTRTKAADFVKPVVALTMSDCRAVMVRICLISYVCAMSVDSPVLVSRFDQF